MIMNILDQPLKQRNLARNRYVKVLNPLRPFVRFKGLFIVKIKKLHLFTKQIFLTFKSFFLFCHLVYNIDVDQLVTDLSESWFCPFGRDVGVLFVWAKVKHLTTFWEKSRSLDMFKSLGERCLMIVTENTGLVVRWLVCLMGNDGGVGWFSDCCWWHLGACSKFGGVTGVHSFSSDSAELLFI